MTIIALLGFHRRLYKVGKKQDNLFPQMITINDTCVLYFLQYMK